MVQVWKDYTCANDKYDPWCNNCKHRAERQENKLEIKKNYTVVQYNKFMKGVDRTDKYLSHY
jgi:hypothetical protein